VASKYCPECGQENQPLRLGVGDIFRDALEEFVKLDSKFVATLKPLMLHPGTLTREWAAGRRVRYISPFKLYLTATFIFFFVSSVQVSRNLDPGIGATPPVKVSMSDPKEEGGLPPALRFFVHTMNKMDDADPRTIANAMLDHLPTALFVMLPVFAFILKLIYIRSRRFYVEHLVFSLHNHAFYFLVFAISVPIPGHFSDPIAVLSCGVYSLVALRRYYGQGWLKTLLKGSMLGCGYSILLLFAVVAAVFLGAMAMPERPTKPKPTKAGKAAPASTMTSAKP
jgi:hypothetical protein